MFAPRGWKIKVAIVSVAFIVVEILLYAFADRPLAEAIRALDTTSHDLIDFFRAITDAGKGKWYLVPTGVVILASAALWRLKTLPPKGRQMIAAVTPPLHLIFAAVAISGIAANIIKIILGRARPELWLKDGLFGFDPFSFGGYFWVSMPSGHTTTAFAVATILIKLFPRFNVLWASYAILLGTSRVFVNAHYLSDAVAGAALGIVTATLYFSYGMPSVHNIIFPIDKREKID